jgi:UDP-N-acetylglucosamine--N-acetylmuramyl-(pentapeptide) pyrophosphoryl-undecaprenol N-acetylglucosamine transferase
MKIVFTGGGTGGHFYPLIAVAEQVNKYVEEHNLVQPDLYYLSDIPYDEGALYENDIMFERISAGKVRTYLSAQNVTDLMRTIIGFPKVLRLMFKLWPDVVFSKGGYISVPVVTAARILRIPVVVHDSDAVPGRANLLAGKFAARIAISYPEASEFFKGKDTVALTGNPVRHGVQKHDTQRSREQLGLDLNLPTLLVIGGSQGAEAINSTILQGIKEILNTYQVVHQTGKNNFTTCKEMAEMELAHHPHKNRYHPVPSYNVHELSLAASAADLIISRAGSGAIFEIATWEKPALIVPIPEDVSRDQRANAYAYARSGAAVVIEQENFTQHLLLSEAERILSDITIIQKMQEGARSFQKPDAAKLIAHELMKVLLKHEL